MQNAPHHESASRRDAWLLTAALLAFFITVVRAYRQSITMDEARSYLDYVWRLAPAEWVPSSNNHLLNTLLMRFFTSMFGVSHLTVRAGGLVGGAIYIAAAYWIARMLSSSTAARMIAFILLVLNPYVFDFLTLARGYGLALGFLLAAIAIALTNVHAIRKCALVSLCLALSSCGNFSFAIVDATILFAIGIWIAGRNLRLWLALLAPGFLVAAILPSWTLLHWPVGELYVGTRSLAQIFRSVLAPHIYEVNRHIVNPLIGSVLDSIKPWLLPAVGTLGALQIVLLRAQQRKAPQTDWRISLTGLLAGATLAALALHWLAFRLTNLLLPENRTAIFFLPLLTVMTMAVATSPGSSLGARLNGRAMMVLLGITACLFLACGRISWVYEWGRLAEVQDAYTFIANCSPESFADAPAADGLYAPTLNFYRRMYAHHPIGDFGSRETDALRGRKGYVLDYEHSRDFLESEGLKVAYHGDSTAIVVAVRPDAEVVTNTAACTQFPIRRDAQGTLHTDREGMVAGLGEFDDTNPIVEYRGGWTSDNQFSGALHGTSTYSNIAGAFLRIAFRGQSITWIYAKSPNRGKAEVLIDGEHRATIDLYSPTVEWKVRSQFSGLKPGDHIFEIRVLGEKTPLATAAFVDVDAFIVE